MDGRNPNTPEHVNGITHPDHIVETSPLDDYQGKIMLFRPHLEDELIYYTNSKKTHGSQLKLTIKKALTGLKKIYSKITNINEK